jgi:integrase
MARNGQFYAGHHQVKGARSSNEKLSRKYDRFGETIRYLTLGELQKLFDCVDDYTHKLMFRMIYELGCRVGEFVRIKLKHIDFGRSSIFFPAENTKTGHRRSSWISRGLLNEITSLLKQQRRMSKRSSKIISPESYLFSATKHFRAPYSENRIRQLFSHYIKKAELDREYGRDTKGRILHQFTVHSLRHSHLMSYIHNYKVPLPVVQKQVGHRTLKSTSVYLNPSEEFVVETYEKASMGTEIFHQNQYSISSRSGYNRKA